MILVIAGSVRADSYTRAAARAAESVLRAKAAEPVLWDLALRPLPIADPEYHERPAEHPDPVVHELVGLADAASGFFLATPVYHNSYSGVLKNCLDHLVIEHFMDKPVALCGFGRLLTAIQAVDHLRIVVRGLYGLALPMQLVTVPADYERDEDGRWRLVGKHALMRLDGMADGLVRYAKVREIMLAAGRQS
jgi:azobenzene reductase